MATSACFVMNVVVIISQFEGRARSMIVIKKHKNSVRFSMPSKKLSKDVMAYFAFPFSVVLRVFESIL